MDDEPVSDIPEWLKWGLAVFNRAGFPALAFILVCYICFVTIKEQTRAIDNFKYVLSEMTQAIDRNTTSVERMTQALYRTR
jgi:hypothetical protein